MSYQLKNYSEAYLDKQYEIGNANISTWLGGQQTPIERLRKIYSQDDFDPETKFYALKDGEVVGFIPAKILANQTEANLEFPLISEGHEDVEDGLMDFAFETLRKKGVTKVMSRASPKWGKTMAYAEKHKYSSKELMWKNAELEVAAYQERGITEDMSNVTKTDFPEIKSILISFREDSPEAAQKQLELLGQISERVTSWKIVREGGKIVGHDHLVQDKLNNQKSRMNAIYATNDSVRDSIMDAHVQAAKANGIESISNFFFGPSEQMDGPYREYGFEVSDLFAFRREL
jgi:uncharacterized glyoxalase superfamily protein PhnB